MSMAMGMVVAMIMAMVVPMGMVMMPTIFTMRMGHRRMIMGYPVLMFVQFMKVRLINLLMQMLM